MSISYDPIAFLTALFAIAFALHESRRNNSVVIKLRDFRYSEHWSPERNRNRGGHFAELAVLLRNQGLAIHDPSLVLTFRGGSGLSRLSVPFKLRTERTGEHSVFSRGMLAEYSLATHELDKGGLAVLGLLKDPAKQGLSLALYSQGYLATSFRIGGLKDRLAWRWSNFAHRFNGLFTRTYHDKTWKSDVVKTRTILPTPRPKHVDVMMFAQTLRKSESDLKAG